MGVKAIKRAKKQQELDVQNIKKGMIDAVGHIATLELDVKNIKNGVVEQKNKIQWIESDVRYNSQKISRVEKESHKNIAGYYDILNDRLNHYVRYFAWLTLFIVAICGYNFGYVFYQLFIK